MIHEVRDGVYISNGSDARRRGDEFEHVITLSRAHARSSIGPHENTTHHAPLHDGPRTSQDDFERAVGVTIKSIQSSQSDSCDHESPEDDQIDTHEGDVLVHCQAGVSRSSTVLITALAAIDDVPFDEAYNEVWEAKPSIAPHPALREMALEFLGEDDKPFSEDSE